MDRAEWRTFLEQWSAEWIAGHDPDSDPPLDQDVVRDVWLGHGPASEAEVAAAEARLGRRLPPSLREFMLVSNGWRDAGNFIYQLAGTTELDWLRNTDDRHWIEIWEDLAEDEADEADPADEDEVDPAVHEAKVLARSLRLSLDGDAAVMLLDPDDVDEDGEWAGYWLASWSDSGPERHSSFFDLMHRQWVSFHALRKPPGATRDHWDAEVERARHQALAGEVDASLGVFAQAHAFGRERADVLSLQLKVLLGDWRGHVADMLWYRPAKDGLLLSPLFAAELLPLLIRHDQLAAPHDLRPLPRLKELAPEPVRALIADYEERAAAPDFRLSFGAPEFDAAVHAVADRLAAHPAFQAPERAAAGTAVIVATARAQYGNPPSAHGPSPDPAAVRASLCDDAWPDLLAALRLWRPVDEDHIAPVSLLADPVLAQLITPDRGRQILTIPRAPTPSSL
ncbi:SMI1/KNR4 family protein [Streptacidiphilus sp. PAMC 29251]